MDNDYDLKYLLKLARRIQRRINKEQDINIRNSLKQDLRIVKAHIGNQVLETPEDEEIFPQTKVSHYSTHNTPIKPTVPRIQIENQNRSLIAEDPQNELIAKFELFLEQKRLQENRTQKSPNRSHRTASPMQNTKKRRSSKSSTKT